MIKFKKENPHYQEGKREKNKITFEIEMLQVDIFYSIPGQKQKVFCEWTL